MPTIITTFRGDVIRKITHESEISALMESKRLLEEEWGVTNLTLHTYDGIHIYVLSPLKQRYYLSKETNGVKQSNNRPSHRRH